jgi:ABC-2 type transport system permease protein
MFVVRALAVVLVALPFGHPPDPGGIAVLLVLLSLLAGLVSAWSNGLGMLLKEIGSLAAIVTGLQLPLTLLSGVLLPLSIAPGCIEALAHLNSLFYAVTAARDLSEGEIFTADVGLAFVVIGALTLAWATRRYRHAIASVRTRSAAARALDRLAPDAAIAVVDHDLRR